MSKDPLPADEVGRLLPTLDRLILDSSAVFDSAIVRIADARNRAVLVTGWTVKLVVPALVHAEHVLQQRMRRGSDYDDRRVDQFLRSKGIEVSAFDAPSADHAAAKLVDVFPTRDRWRAAKRSATIRAMQLAPDPNPGGPAPGTTDWWIAGPSAHDDCLFVTEDRGPEFAWIRRCNRGTLLEALEAAVIDAW